MMKEITVKSNDTRNFSFFISGNGIGTLIYKNWFTLSAEIKLADHQNFIIEPKGLWGTTVEVKKDEKTLLSFKMSWGGNIIFKTFLGGKETEFIFKKKGMLKNVYTLSDKDGNQLIEVQPDFKWGKMSFDYVIVANDIFDKEYENRLMYISAIHCANYYTAMMSSVSAGSIS